MGFPLDPQAMTELARRVGEHTLLDRTGGAPSLAVGMAQIFSGTIGGERLLGIWYHFAIMFEALFILTVLDAGTRVGRFMVQHFGGHFWKPLGRTNWAPGVWISSGLIVGAWGFFLWQGVQDPLGESILCGRSLELPINSLATVALVVATTIILKMGERRFAWVTLAPMAWLVTVTMTASYQKVFHSNPRIGFLAQVRVLSAQLASGAIPADRAAITHRMIFNNRLDVAVTWLLAGMVLVLVIEAIGEWIAILRGTKTAELHEAPYRVTEWAEADR